MTTHLFSKEIPTIMMVVITTYNITCDAEGAQYVVSTGEGGGAEGAIDGTADGAAVPFHIDVMSACTVGDMFDMVDLYKHAFFWGMPNAASF